MYCADIFYQSAFSVNALLEEMLLDIVSEEIELLRERDILDITDVVSNLSCEEILDALAQLNAAWLYWHKILFSDIHEDARWAL